MKLFKDYAEFKAVDRNLRLKGKELSDEYLSHVKDALTFFHTTGNHNIQIVNDILDTASAMRLQRNRIVDWLYALVGHELVKVEGGRFGFGKKLETTDYEIVVSRAPDHFELYPDWYAWKKDPDPEEFDAKKTVQSVIKRLKNAAKDLGEHDYATVSLMLAEIAKRLETTPIEINDEPEGDDDAVVPTVGASNSVQVLNA